MKKWGHWCGAQLVHGLPRAAVAVVAVVVVVVVAVVAVGVVGVVVVVVVAVVVAVVVVDDGAVDYVVDSDGYDFRL